MVPLSLFIILGIMQGVLEWLPVSSEGQILFVGSVFGISDPQILLSIAFWLHFGTMFSVLIYYRSEWREVLDLRNEEMNYLRKFLVITTLGTAIVGIPIKLFILESFIDDDLGIVIMVILAVALIFTAFLLKFQENKDHGSKSLHELSAIQMLTVGFAQGFTIIPGVSRSGTTVTMLLILDISGEESFRGSFFMSVPAVLGAITLDLLGYFLGDSSSILVIDPFGLIISIIFAIIFGLLTMKILLKFAQNTEFSRIVFILALFVIIYIVFLGI